MPAPLFRRQSEVFVSHVSPYSELPTERTCTTMVYMMGGGDLKSQLGMHREKVTGSAVASTGVSHTGHRAGSIRKTC